MMIERLRLAHIFSDDHRLNNINLTLYDRELAAVVARNQNHQQGLFQLISGESTPTFGHLYVDGQPVTLDGRVDAQRKGIGSLTRRSQLVPNLSIYENIFIATKGSYLERLLPRHIYLTETRRLLAQAGLEHISPTAKPWRLTVAEGHLVEIMKASVLQTRVLIVDDVLDDYQPWELKRLEDVLLSMRDQGMAVLLFTRQYNPLFSVLDRLTVLRDGTTVCHLEEPPLSEWELATYLGGKPPETPPETQHPVGKRPLLEVKELTTESVSTPISFQAYPGEVLGVVQPDGLKSVAIGRALHGRQPYCGQVIYDGQRLSIDSQKAAAKAGFFYMEPAEFEQQLFPNMSLLDNVTLYLDPTFDHPGGLMNMRTRRFVTRETVNTLGFSSLVSRYGLDTPLGPVERLERRQILLARAYCARPRVLTLINPHLSFDEFGEERLVDLFEKFTAQGTVVLLFSVSHSALASVSHRIISL